jgi:S-adenosylmethionine synthetase
MNHGITSFLIISSILFSPLTQADRLVIDVEKIKQSRAKLDFKLPTRGLKMTQVEAKYGKPVSVIPAIGKPPITEWKYANFSVYFEYKTVIHAVVR